MAPQLLAQSDEGLSDLAEGASSGLAELINRFVPGQLHFVVEWVVSPGLTVALVLIIGLVLSALARRSIRVLVERMKRPEGLVGANRFGERDEEDRIAQLRREQRADALGGLAGSISKVVIWFLVITVALAQVGIELGPLIAGAGIAGVAIGFGAQDLVKDFLSGVFMLIEDQYGIGDIIDVGEAAGVVEGISLRSTRLRAVDGTLWHVPNGEIRRVGNMSQGWARALVDVSVAYATDVDAASEVILSVATDMAEEEEYREVFLETPEVWGVEALADSSIDIRLVIKTEPGKQWAIARELRRRIKNAFDAAEVEIPFPQQVVWLRTEQAAALGDADTAGFEPARIDAHGSERARSAAKQGDTTPPPGDLDDMLPSSQELIAEGEED